MTAVRAWMKPPENVAALEPDIRGATTIREQLAKHRQIESCSSCHVFGDFDSLAWDLGDPASSVVLNNNPFVKLNAPLQNFGLTGPTLNFLQPNSVVAGNLDFHPLKGPMTTQTLRGMDHGGPMHWRGDRSGGTAQNPWAYDGTPSALDETLAFQAFNPAFVGLLGRQTTIPADDMTSTVTGR